MNGSVFLRCKGIMLCIYINMILKIGFRRVFRRPEKNILIFFNTDESFKKNSMCGHALKSEIQ